jgi:hypothetical protein
MHIFPLPSSPCPLLLIPLFLHFFLLLPLSVPSIFCLTLYVTLPPPASSISSQISTLPLSSPSFSLLSLSSFLFPCSLPPLPVLTYSILVGLSSHLPSLYSSGLGGFNFKCHSSPGVNKSEDLKGKRGENEV